MKQKQFYILIITLAVSLSAKAQSYDAQYQICSALLNKLTKVDSLYLAMVQTRDSCLIGSVAPNFQAFTIDSEKIELSKLQGQVVVLNFWFTRCSPCIEEIPALNKLVKLYAGRNVTFISLTNDSLATVTKFLKEHPFKFRVVANDDSVRHNIFKLFSAWPYTIIINKEGKIMDMQLGSKGGNTFSYFSKQIDNLL